MEMSSYIGDVLTYYTDSNLKESLLGFAEERSNINAISNALGYKTKNMISSLVDLDVYQTVPATGTGVNAKPDWNYALTLNSGMRCKSNTGIEFRTLDPVDFHATGSATRPRTVTVYQVDESTGTPTYF